MLQWWRLREQAVDLRLDLGDAERLALHLVEALGVDQVLGTDDEPELTQIQLWDQHSREPIEDVAQVPGERVDVAEVAVRDRLALGLGHVDRGGAGAVGAAPAEDEQVAGLGPVDRLLGDVVGHQGDLPLAGVDHVLVVVGVVRHIAGAVLLLQTSDAVLQPDRAGDGPGPGQPFVTLVGQEVLVVFPRTRVRDLELRQVGDRRDPPRLRPVGDVAVGQQEHRGHEADGDPPSLLRNVEAIAGAAGGDHRHGALAVAAVEGLEQVGLLGLGRQPSGGAAALDIDDDHRQLGHHG